MPPRQRHHRDADLDTIIGRQAPVFQSFYVEEPKLLFGGSGYQVDPKTGLEQFGPFQARKPEIRIGVIGTADGIDAFKAYLERARQTINPGLNSRNKPYDPLLFPDFPGVSPEGAFRTTFVTDPSIQRSIPETLFERAAGAGLAEFKVRQVIELVTKELGVLADCEPEPDVVAVVLPPIVEKQCAGVGRLPGAGKIPLTPVQRMKRNWEKKRAKTGQSFFELDFNDTDNPSQRGFWNIHHALKAHAMPTELTTQLIWESKLRGRGLTQDPASMAWNLFTALFYKAGNIPWQLQQVPQNTCFVGVCFYREGPFDGAGMQTSLAQVFSGVGEGLVLKGQPAVVDKARGDRKAHLTEDSARKLLEQAIALYEVHHQGQKPGRVVVHKTSRYWPEELAGFKKGLGDIARYDFLALEKLDIRFMRMGEHPPIRGTVVTLAPRRHAIFTVGYVPYLKDYPGYRVPVPLEIVEHYGDSPAEQVCRHILALTKVNWNSCAFACSDPITTQFARTVGRILTEIPKGINPQTKYRYYM